MTAVFSRADYGGQPYKHGVVTCGRSMTYIIDITAYGGCH